MIFNYYYIYNKYHLNNIFIFYKFFYKYSHLLLFKSIFNKHICVDFKYYYKVYVFKKINLNLKLKDFNKNILISKKTFSSNYLLNNFINEWGSQFFIKSNLYYLGKKLILTSCNKVLNNIIYTQKINNYLEYFVKSRPRSNNILTFNYFYNNLFFNFLSKKLNKMYFIYYFDKKICNYTNNTGLLKFYNNNFYKLINYFVSVNDFYSSNEKYFNLLEMKHFNSNSIFSKKLNEIVNKQFGYKKYFLYSNYYPIFLLKNNLNNIFFKKFSFFYSGGYNMYLNNFIIPFLENILKKSLFIKLINNSFYESYNWYLNNILNEYRFYKPIYFKSYETSDFIKILWYSFFFKDISIFSKWVSIFMETLNFKNHKKFLLFFNNFIKKYSAVFEDVLKIKGFFFDIRGKVGVTGSSKKRHLTIKFGRLNKFSKKNKIDYDLKLVRTYSGVMGLTYIINY